MTSQAAISAIAAWIRDEVCPGISLTAAYDWQEVRDHEDIILKQVSPAVYETYFPRTAAEHTMKDDSALQTAPCVIVTISGQSTLSSENGMIEYPFRLLLQTWHPGQRATSATGQVGFNVDADGWRDVAGFADTLAKKLVCAECPGGLCVTSDIITTLPDVAENDFYPYYRAEISFTATAARLLPKKFDI